MQIEVPQGSVASVQILSGNAISIQLVPPHYHSYVMNLLMTPCTPAGDGMITGLTASLAKSSDNTEPST